MVLVNSSNSVFPPTVPLPSGGCLVLKLRFFYSWFRYTLKHRDFFLHLRTRSPGLALPVISLHTPLPSALLGWASCSYHVSTSLAVLGFLNNLIFLTLLV